MFSFKYDGKEKDDLMLTKNNTKVLVTLAICALIGGIIAGLLIRFLMRKFFPSDEEEQPMFQGTSSGQKKFGDS